MSNFYGAVRADEYVVPRKGLEPPQPYDRQHLKLVRLPISPPGHLAILPLIDFYECSLNYAYLFEELHYYRLV